MTAASEANTEIDIRLAASEDGNRLFRNNVGAYQNARRQWVHYGVGGNGGSDEIGWTAVTVTPDMVGATVAVFTAIEVKSKRGAIRKEQEQFIGSVRRGGGIAGIARSPDDYRAIIAAYVAGLSCGR